MEKITKLEAARRELRTAIRLFFERKDAVSIHTLVCAAREIICDLAKQDGKQGMIDNAAKLVRPEWQKEYHAAIRKPQNFFKHADKDPNEEIEFRPEFTRFILCDALVVYQLLTGRHLREGQIFLAWFVAAYPHCFLDTPFTRIVKGGLATRFDPNDYSVVNAALNGAQIPNTD